MELIWKIAEYRTNGAPLVLSNFATQLRALATKCCLVSARP
jgi:hypothetical protein